MTPAEHRVFKEVTKRIPRKGVVNKSASDIGIALSMETNTVRACLDGLVDVKAIRYGDGGGIIPTGKCKCRTENHSQKVPLSNLVTNQSTNQMINHSTHTSTNRITHKGYAFIRNSEGKSRFPFKVKPISKWNSFDLAKYFGQEVNWHLRSKLVKSYPVNFKALGKFFAEELRNGVEPETCKAMVDTFVKSTKRMREINVPPWKMYIAQRQRLWTQVQKKKNSPEVHRHDKDYWTAWSK